MALHQVIGNWVSLCLTTLLVQLAANPPLLHIMVVKNVFPSLVTSAHKLPAVRASQYMGGVVGYQCIGSHPNWGAQPSYLSLAMYAECAC